jgi:zinc finger SWIM domain-containing protein 3
VSCGVVSTVVLTVVLFTGIMLESLVYVRPVMSLDAAHMKTTGGGGTLYIASVKSATNEIYPVAVSLMIDPENKAGWVWFLEHMKACLPVLDTEHRKANVAYKRYTFMSDRNKGLIEALKEVFPLNHSCHCAIHIARNVEAQFGARNAKFVVQLAKTFSTTYADDILQRMNVPARTYVSRIDAQVWRSVAWLQDESLPPRYGIVTSNMSESANNMFEKARDVHWLSSLNMMLTKMAERIATLSDKYANHTGVVSNVKEILQHHWNGCAGMKILSINHEREELFTVLEPPRQGVYNDPTGYNVNTSLKACDCGMWQEHGFPCIHAVAIFRKKEVSFAALLEEVDDIHTYEMNVELFKRNLLTVCIEKVVPDRSVLAPIFTKRKLGRPKKKRHRKRSCVSTSPNAGRESETPESSRASRATRCRLCGVVGHNARTCSRKQPRGEEAADPLDHVIPDMDLL